MQATWHPSLGQEDPLEKEMATHSSILAWKIPWTEKPGGVHSLGSQRVRHNWACTHVHTHTHKYIQEVRVKVFPGGSEVKASAHNAGDLGLIPGSGRSPGEGNSNPLRSPGEGNSNPLQYSCLENPMEGGAWWATVHGITKSQTRLSGFTFTFKSESKFC